MQTRKNDKMRTIYDKPRPYWYTYYYFDSNETSSKLIFDYKAGSIFIERFTTTYYDLKVRTPQNAFKNFKFYKTRDFFVIF